MDESKESNSRRQGSTLVGFVTFAMLAVGVGAIIGASVAASIKDFTGVGACLIASALSFGLLLNALLRE